MIYSAHVIRQGYRIWISFGAAEAASQAMKALRAVVS
jgi:hypothetical protein